MGTPLLSRLRNDMVTLLAARSAALQPSTINGSASALASHELLVRTLIQHICVQTPDKAASRQQAATTVGMLLGSSSEATALG